MTPTTIPRLNAIKDIYPEKSIDTQTKRWDGLLAEFESTYGNPATYVSRSPGRVNLIGEHIDYSLYPVVPMAVEQDVLLAARLSPASGSTPRIRLTNRDGAKFKPAEFNLDDNGTVEIDSSKLEWTNYFKAGLRGAVGLLQKSHPDNHLTSDLDILATGSVPAGGGMSSSAAFVCASALAVLHAAGITDIDKKSLVETAIVSERSVGVNSGGMDQSASVFGEKGSALHVRFIPELKVSPITFPTIAEPLTFVVAQSLVAADKHTSAPVCYNLRVVECTLAALILARITGAGHLTPDSSPLGVSLRTFHTTFFAKQARSGNDDTSTAPDPETAQLEQLIQLVEDYLPQEEGYSRAEISDILGTDIPALEERYMTKFPVRAERFLLRQRATHVFTEALRVSRFVGLLNGAQDASDADKASLLDDMGALLNATQDSCRDVFDCSCPELNELCEIARSAGAKGSRLTGAGWGGCSVHLVPVGRVDGLRQAWTDRYYKKRFPDISEEKLKEAIVVSEPGKGSCIYVIVQ